MPSEVIMPKIDMDMTHGTIMTWHVAEGDSVETGAPLFDIETDKAAMEVESPASGRLHHRVPKGTQVAIGQPVAWLYGPDEAVGAPPETARPQAAPEADTPRDTAPPRSEAEAEAEATEDAGPDGLRATPKARALARNRGIDLAGITGSGPRGRIQAEDVPDTAEQPPAPSLAAPAPAHFAPDHGPLAVTRSKGGTGDPVVLIHGFAGEALGWAPLEPHLGPRPLVRIELPGHGKSPRRAPARFADLVAELRHTLDGLDLGPVHLIGHSLGGALALALADTRPRATQGLTLIAPAGLGPEINGAALEGIARATQVESLAPWLKTLAADPAMITDAYARLAWAARQDPALRAAQQAYARALFPDGTQAFDLTGALDRVTAPTQILWGKADRILPWRHALRAPGPVALHFFEGLGHMPHLEDPQTVGKVIARAL